MRVNFHLLVTLRAIDHSLQRIRIILLRRDFGTSIRASSLSSDVGKDVCRYKKPVTVGTLIDGMSVKRRLDHLTFAARTSQLAGLLERDNSIAVVGVESDSAHRLAVCALQGRLPNYKLQRCPTVQAVHDTSAPD